MTSRPKARKRHAGHHLLSLGGVIAVTLIAFGSLGGAVLYTQDYLQSGQMAAVISGVLVNLLNGDRSSNGLGTLTVSPLLTEAAQEKANDEAANSYFAHVSPQGKNSWYWFKQVGYNFIYAGENLAVNFTDSDAVETAWMNSPTHRANILNAHFTQVGIATATGTYQGYPTIFVVQMFGTPAAASAGPAATIVAVNNPASAQEIAVAKTDVLGASAQSATAVPTTAATTAPAAASAPASAPAPSLINYAAASPLTDLRDLYIALGVLVLLAVVSVTGFEFKRHHMRHAFAGLFLIVLLGVLYAVAGQYVFSTPLLAVSSAQSAS